MSDLTQERVAARLSTFALGRSLALKSATASTNDDARKAALAGAPHGHVVVADAQTQGRGSRGRTWESPAGTDLYVSIVAELPVPLADLPPLTLAVGLAAVEALEGELGGAASPRVKWPNDVWVGRRKLAGVLVESSSSGERTEPLVIGIGINVNRTSFPSELSGQATSLSLETGRTHDRAEVLAALLNRLEPWLDRFVSEGARPIIAALTPRLALVGERAVCDGLEGVVEGITNSGALLLRNDAGQHTCFAGTLRPCEGADEAPA
jgi:BirA family biotin operon repressor/biotin-[acetyl-CoA-carboxylase] ligase